MIFRNNFANKLNKFVNLFNVKEFDGLYICKIRNDITLTDITDVVVYEIIQDIEDAENFLQMIFDHNLNSVEEIFRKYDIIKILKEKQPQIISVALDLNNILFEEIDDLLELGFKPDVIVSCLLYEKLKSLSNATVDQITDKIIGIVREYNISKLSFNFNSGFINPNFSKEFLKFISENLIALKELLNNYLASCQNSENLSIEKQLSDIVYLSSNIDFNNAVLNIKPEIVISLPQEVIAYLTNKKLTIQDIFYNIITQHDNITDGLIESNLIIKFIETHFSDSNTINQRYSDGRSVLELMMDYNYDIDVINYLIQSGINQKISIKTYLDNLFKNLLFSEAVNRVNTFDNFTEHEVVQHLRANGMSNNDVSLLTNVINTTKEFIKYNDHKESNLSEKEFKIINPDYTEFDKLDFDINESNSYGFTQIHLLLLSGRYGVILELLKDNLDLIDDYVLLRIISIQKNLYQHKNKDDFLKLEKFVIINSDNIDLITNNGESLVDTLINDSQYKELILSKTKDSLYHFLKPDLDLETIVLNPQKTHIAISHGSSYWSGGIFSFARLAMKESTDVEFHIVNMDILDSSGNNLIKQMDGWINPGGADSYPKNMKMFDKSSWSKTLDTEKIYQHVLDQTHKLHIPYLGICAGAQNLVLNHDGYLYPLKGYGDGKHEISLIEGTLIHFQSMNKVQQQIALKTCEFPVIKFYGDTAHNYAAVIDELGSGIKLGGVSEDGVAMSYAHSNGLRFATQFHPEHMYNVKTGNDTNHQKVFLNNFIELAVTHHNARTGSIHPIEYMQDVGEKLHQCIEMQICTNQFNIETLFDI